jgi:O-antigen ligase
MIIYTFKRLIIVLTLAAIVFHLAKPIALRFMSSEDFSRRRFVWFLLTVVSFVSPSFWLYALVAVPTFLWANRKDSNPIALYLLMLHVVPPFGFNIPILGKNGLFPLDNYRLLAICVLLPTAMRYRKNREEAATGGLGTMDVLLLAFGALQVALYTSPDLPVPIPDSWSNALRRAVLFCFDTYLLYFTVSRTCQSRNKIVDAAASFCLACGVMASIAIFENLRHWLLYLEVVGNWGFPLRDVDWLTRGVELRAQASAGHPLSLGFLLAIAFGLWLYLKTHVQRGPRRIASPLLLWGGLFAAFSRGPWLGAVTAYFTFFAAGPRAASRLAKGALLALGVGLLIMLSPIGDRILDVLPIMGNKADANIIYRERLSERGWEIVMRHPLFGDRFPYPEMEDLRQGEGIIDFVNSYLQVALNYGLIGLSLFLSFILLGISRIFARTRALMHSDPDLALLGVSLIACIVAALEMIYSASFGLGAQKMFYVLAGLATAYSAMPVSPRHRPAASSALRPTQD